MSAGLTLESVEIRGFKRLRGEWELGGELTLVTGPNESGKSTLHEALIRALFGFSPEERRNREGSSPKDERSPWDGGPFGAVLRVLDSGGRELLLTWDFARGLAILEDALTGQTLGREQPKQRHDYELGAQLVGMKREEFLQVCCLYQGALQPLLASEELELSLQRALESAPGGETGVQDADANLRGRLQALGVNVLTYRELRDGALAQAIARESELEQGLEQARAQRSELQALSGRLREGRDRAKAFEGRVGDLEGTPLQESPPDPLLSRFIERRDELIAERALSASRRPNQGLLVVAGAFALCGVLGAVLVTPLLVSLLLIALACGWAARIERGSVKEATLSEFGGRSFEELDHAREEMEEEARECRRLAERELVRARSELGEAQLEVAKLEGLVEQQETLLLDPAGIEVELAGVRATRAKAELERDAIRVARDALQQAASETRRRVAPRLVEALRRELPTLTRGRYCRCTVSEDLQIRLHAPETGDLVSVEQLSRGTRDQVALIQRLEIARLLDSGAANAPLLLDDPFAHFDSERLRLASRLLSEISTRRQVILFSEAAEVIEAIVESHPSTVLIELPDPVSEPEPVVLRGGLSPRAASPSSPERRGACRAACRCQRAV